MCCVPMWLPDTGMLAMFGVCFFPKSYIPWGFRGADGVKAPYN